MAIKEGEKVKAKVIHNIFKKIIAKKIPDLKKELPVLV
jgi:hypothetical protein